MKPTPILFYSDSPSLPTGLARITKDLASNTATLPEFRVGVLGRGGHGSSQLPFAQFNFPEADQWGEAHVESVWDDFARGDHGIIFTIWDLSRLDWFARPRGLGNERLEKFLQSGRFEKWAYVPVDSIGVGGRLTTQARDILGGFHRVLAYTLFGQSVIQASTPGGSANGRVDWIPHGYNPKVFAPRAKAPGRAMLGFAKDHIVVGCVMTNQARKDWAAWAEAMAYLKDKIGPRLRLWAHTDLVVRYWNMYALILDFGLQDVVRLTFNGDYTSEQLSYLYSTCDITVLPSLGEGFGYPIIESLACGVPVIHGAYGGGQELVPERDWLVEPVGLRLDGMWNNYRPVWNPKAWADKVAEVLEDGAGGTLAETCTRAVEHLQWEKLWPATWKRWLLDGIKQGS